MNKLVSRNPIQRFKQGRKIVKAEKGVRFQRVGSTWFPGLKSSTMEYVFYDHNTGDYITSTKPEITSLEGTINRGKSYSKYGYSWKEKEFARTPNSTPKSRDYSFMKGGTNQRSPEAEALLKDKKVQKYLKRQESQGFTAKPTPKKVITPTSQKVTTPHFQSQYKNLMQQRGITADQIIEWQNKLKDFYDPNAKYKSADGIWGQDTEAAYQRYLSSKNIPTYTKAELTDNTPATPTTPTIQEKPVQQNDFASQKQTGYPSNQSKGEQLFNSINLRPEFKYSYSNYKNFNPYKFDLRPMYKQGGQLPSRNIVKRFKNRKFFN